MTPDDAILVWLHSTLASDFSNALFLWFSSSYGFSIPILLALLVYSVHKQGWRGAGWWLSLILVVATGDQLGNVLKATFTEFRPCADNEDILQINLNLACSRVAKGMPSNHALSFYAASFYLILTRPRWQAWHSLLLVAALLASVSRVYLAKHYPSQVTAGFFIGLYLGVSAGLLYRAKQWYAPLMFRLARLANLEPWQHPSTDRRQRDKYRDDHRTSEGSGHANPA